MANNVSTLKTFFSTKEKPVTANEMMEFWKSLTDEEKELFKNAEITH